MKNIKKTELITAEQMNAIIKAFQVLLLDFADSLPDVSKALLRMSNKVLIQSTAQKEVFKSVKKGKK